MQRGKISSSALEDEILANVNCQSVRWALAFDLLKFNTHFPLRLLEMGLVSIRCPVCKVDVAVPDSYGGRTTKCLACGTQFKISFTRVGPTRPSRRTDEFKSLDDYLQKP